MKNAVIVLNYRNTDLGIIYKNIQTACMPIDSLQIVNQTGIAKAMNLGIKLCGYHDLYTFISNDIEEPDNWLKIRNEFMQDESIGMCSFPIDNPKDYNEQDIIGNLTISRKLFETIGEFNQFFDPYGPIDLDYCHRSRIAGFKTMYIPGYFSLHPWEHASGNKYGYDKKKMVDDSWGQHVQDVVAYMSGEKSVYIINQSEWQ